jgi:hypothetical protein
LFTIMLAIQPAISPSTTQAINDISFLLRVNDVTLREWF